MKHTPFETVQHWITEERFYQVEKFDYEVEELEKIKHGIDEDSYIWRGLTNYIGRVRLFGLDTPNGLQAWMKLMATMIGFSEQIIRTHGLPPAPGQSSGNTNPWHEEDRIYISGPMTGLPGKNLEAFTSAATQVEEAGFYPINPGKHGINPSWSYHDYLRLDVILLLSCQGILMLDGWRDSNGALIERELAIRLAMPVFYSVDEIDLTVDPLSTYHVQS